MPGTRAFLDFRTVPNSGCALTIAGDAEEVEQAALEHGLSAHHREDTPRYRIEVRAALSESQPLVPAPGRKILDCRDLAGREACSLSFTGPEDDVVRAAFRHLVRRHRERPNTELEDEIRLSLRDLTPATAPYERA